MSWAIKQKFQFNTHSHTVRHNFLTGENIDEFDEFPAIFPIKIFHLVSYSMLMIGIRQFFTRQNFPNPDSSKFSTVKILCHTVATMHDENLILMWCSSLVQNVWLYS